VIVRDDGLGVPQTTHSALSGRLAAAWRIDEDLPVDDLVTAATIHDIGWTEWERDPQPVSFLDVPTSEHVAIWTAGTDAASTFGRWVSLLVALHCTRLMTWRKEAGKGSPELDALVARETARQSALREGLDDDVVERASRLIMRWDGLSLALCGFGEPELDPWPFTADHVPLTVEARDLETGEWRTLDVSLTRG
jgi:hypothetical protein